MGLPGSTLRGGRFLLCAALILQVSQIAARANPPPQYKSFKRDQKMQHSYQEQDLMRIWMVYVGQGDGLIVQLPKKFNYQVGENGEAREERLDIMIDGGSFLTGDSRQMQTVIKQLYVGQTPTIEYAIITHHDKDHVKGLELLLENDGIAVETIFHNGLASYRPGERGFPNTVPPELQRLMIYTEGNATLTRGMAFLEEDEVRVCSDYLIANLEQLLDSYSSAELQGVYEDLAEAVVGKTSPVRVREFLRASVGAPFVMEHESQQERGGPLTGLSLDLVWPTGELKKYGSSASKAWGYTINGNSLSFVLRYGEFEIFFTGDQNEESEAALIDYLGANHARLDCDVLKVPHHGSSHGIKEFFQWTDGEGKLHQPVLGICSMGEKGFSLEDGYKHPSNEAISWMGGAHRVYHTHIHERVFNWETMSDAEMGEMIERRHVLVETDREWFRVVEVELTHPDLNDPPTVEETRRGDGTWWIRAN